MNDKKGGSSFNAFDVVAIRTSQGLGVSNVDLGNMLADFVDNGGNVVFFCCRTVF